MKLNLEKIQALVPSGAVDESIFKSIVAQAKAAGQGLIFDSDKISEEAIRTLAVEIATEHEEVRATDEDLNRDRNSKEGADRFSWWCNTGKNGNRLAETAFNQNKIVEVLRQLGGLSSYNIDRAIEILDGVLQWKQVAPPPAPAQVAPPQPAPVVRILPSGEPELSIDATDAEMRRASIEQLRDLDSRRRNPSRKFKAVTQGAMPLMTLVHEYEPMPQEISRKALINASRSLFESWKRRFGEAAIDARLQGRG
jgi:hypothetical protein